MTSTIPHPETNQASYEANNQPAPNKSTDVFIGGYRVPASPQIKPFTAFHHTVKLLRNKEDTSQVFAITEALSGRSSHKQFARFINTEYGQRVIEEPIEIERELADFDALRAMPEGSFGRAYLNFMEDGGLTPEGIINVIEDRGLDLNDDTYPEFFRFVKHLSTVHDVWHVITGYNRDGLGELCLLVVTRTQSGNNAFRLIVSMGLAALKREQWSLPASKILNEAKLIGENCQWLHAMDIVSLLPKPLEEVRREMKLAKPDLYRSVPLEVRNSLLQPSTPPPSTQDPSIMAA